MRRIDNKLMVAFVLTTLIAILGYAFLSWLMYRYAQNMDATIIASSAPLIVIGQIKHHWWWIYGGAVFMLIYRWAIKREMR